MKSLFLINLIAFISFSLSAQQTCRVKVAEIEGKYTGGCKKGYAEGNGTATGLYTYIGDFKKGVPNGNGRMVWSDDSVFVGEWKKGARTGEGVLIVRGDTLAGFWSRDEYLGKENFRYKLISSVSTISRVTFNRLDNGLNRIQIRIEKETRPQLIGSPLIVVSQGSWDRSPRGDQYVRVLENVVYPFQASVNNQFEFVINQPGHWDILVQLAPTKD